MKDPTERFASRVEPYIKYRPSYPEAILETLTAAGELTPDDVVADVGSGTGKLSELFLRNGNRVIGVEPNAAMRQAGERLLGGYPRFSSVAGRAEATGLPDASVDIVAAGQAFHWFDPRAARAEFRRILRPGGLVVLVWNYRRTESSLFMTGYEEFLHEYGTDYGRVRHERIGPDEFRALFGHGNYALRTFRRDRDVDFDGLAGLLLSTSYVPEPHDPAFDKLIQRLRVLFDAFQVGGLVRLAYKTRVISGHLGEAAT